MYTKDRTKDDTKLVHNSYETIRSKNILVRKLFKRHTKEKDFHTKQSLDNFSHHFYTNFFVSPSYEFRIFIRISYDRLVQNLWTLPNGW